MVATFNDIPSKTIIFVSSLALVGLYPTNSNDETDFITFYNELSSLVRSIPKHNVLIIGRDMNT